MIDVKGKISSVSVDYYRQQTLLTLAIPEKPEIFNELLDTDLSIKLSKYRERRSLDANAYAWVLMSKIADAVNSSKEDVYETMLNRYGVFYQDDNGYVVVTVKSNVDMSAIYGHWRKIKDIDGFSSYMMIKGSSEYNTEEMAHFIDGVIYEAKALGIETETPDEIERMKNIWQKNSGRS